MSDAAPVTFSMTRRVQFAETDMAGILHFANYFRMMEELEHAYFRSLGLSIDMQHDGRHISWPRVASACDYSGPARFEDELTLNLRITRVGGKALSYEVDFLRAGQDIALGKMTIVCCEVSNVGMKSIAIPAAIRAKLPQA